MTRKAPFALCALILTGAFAGCIGDPDAEIQIAFNPRTTDLLPWSDKNPRALADWVEAETGRTAAIYRVDDHNAALSALWSGQADLAFVDGAAGWLGWQQLDLEVIAADQKADGRTYYNASAWVLADSPIQTVADLEGATSCHTGRLKSAGMFMPMSYLIREGHMSTEGYPDEISAVVDMAHDFFDDPVIGGAYGGYAGALKCISDGTGDVAFVRDTSPDDYCGEQPADWCLPRDGYRLLQEFGPVPGHPIMVGPHVDDDLRQELLDALLALNTEPGGQTILSNVLETPGLTAVDAETHLGGYGDLISVLPGITTYAEGR